MPDDSDPRGYLETEARIIAENETHVAIAVRLDKATIARNLPLLAALADVTVCTVKKLFPTKI